MAENLHDPVNDHVGPVVVGVDGSDESRRGLEVGASLATRLDVELVAVHVLGLTTHIGGRVAPSHGYEAEIAEAMRTTWCADLATRPGLSWRWEIVQGEAVHGLIDAADAVDASFIVVGTHGSGGSTAPLLGSTSHYVVSNSHRPVVVVPPVDNLVAQVTGAGSGAMNAVVADA